MANASPVAQGPTTFGQQRLAARPSPWSLGVNAPSDLASPAKRARALLASSLAQAPQASTARSGSGAARGLEPRDRAFVRMLVATCLRRLGQIDAVLSAFLHARAARRRPRRTTTRRGPAAVSRHARPRRRGDDGRVGENAIGTSRGFEQRRDAARRRRTAALLVAAQDAARLNTPDWLWRSWSEAYGEPAARASALKCICKKRRSTFPSKTRAHLADWASRLGATPLPTGGLRLASHGRIQDLAGFEDGAWWVQDAAAV